jgi:hypothetical protein
MATSDDPHMQPLTPIKLDKQTYWPALGGPILQVAGTMDPCAS